MVGGRQCVCVCQAADENTFTYVDVGYVECGWCVCMEGRWGSEGVRWGANLKGRPQVYRPVHTGAKLHLPFLGESELEV